jgi:hypothetical protein
MKSGKLYKVIRIPKCVVMLVALAGLSKIVYADTAEPPTLEENSDTCSSKTCTQQNCERQELLDSQQSFFTGKYGNKAKTDSEWVYVAAYNAICRIDYYDQYGEVDDQMKETINCVTSSSSSCPTCTEGSKGSCEMDFYRAVLTHLTELDKGSCKMASASV